MEKPVALGADHGGFALKEAVRAHLDERGVPYVDYGTHSEASVDYPDMAVPPCEAVVRGECACALLFCGTGVGISMAANKLDGIRACCCSDAFSAKYTRLHNDANIACFGARTTGEEVALDALRTFLGTGFEGGRHQRRLDKLAPSALA